MKPVIYSYNHVMKKWRGLVTPIVTVLMQKTDSLETSLWPRKRLGRCGGLGKYLHLVIKKTLNTKIYNNENYIYKYTQQNTVDDSNSSDDYKIDYCHIIITITTKNNIKGAMIFTRRKTQFGEDNMRMRCVIAVQCFCTRC